jgi:hypothetical protein
MKFSGAAVQLQIMKKKFTTQKLKKSQKFVLELSGRIGGINRQYHEKIIGKRRKI